MVNDHIILPENRRGVLLEFLKEMTFYGPEVKRNEEGIG